MGTVTSSDGTPIAFDRSGDGPAIILVDGVGGHRAFGPNPQLAPLLAQHLTVYTYDRRGRGDSGDTQPFAAEREIEDLAALIKHAGGSAFVYGVSSGAALALEAASRGLAIERLALYEAPFIVDDSRPPIPDDYVRRLDELIATGHRGDAIRLFMTRGVGLSPVIVAMMRLLPAWSQLKAIAHTVPYDVAFVEAYQRGRPLPAQRWAAVTVPTLVAVGGKSPGWMRAGMAQLAEVLPNAHHRTLEGQTHIVKAQALAPVLLEHFGGASA